ncbi:uncharacterized protein LOC134834711 [Culicoides brevitarsis]|uniref:uncharacterized protein LOC134834711 n=1 Tax=Culicoides brevitarsis TaxID=469753 RepID=UPI00307B7A40
MDISTIVISDYLKSKGPKRGLCKLCSTEVFWTIIKLISHKRTRCPVPEDEKAFWLAASAVSQTRKISDFLDDKSIVNHKRKKCVNSGTSTFYETTQEDKIEPNVNALKKDETTHNHEKQSEIRISSTDIISEYLNNKNSLTRRGTCSFCQSSVFWTLSHLSLHKLRKCPIPEADKLYWMNIQEKLMQAKNSKEDEINIGNYLTNKNKVTRRGTCTVCHKRVFWATSHLASHKKSKCPISENEKLFWNTIQKGNNLSTYVAKNKNIPENLNVNTMKGYTKKRNCVASKSSFINQSYICDFCHKKFKKKRSLKHHIFIHVQCYKIPLQVDQRKREEIDSTSVVFGNIALEKCTIEQMFECCQKMHTFSSLAQHQFKCHAENFHLMISSMRTEILNALSSNNAYEDNIAKDTENSKEIEKNYSKFNTVPTNDTIIQNIIVQCFICESKFSALCYDKHLTTAHPLEDGLNAKRATNKFFCNWCCQTFNKISQCITHIKHTCSENPEIPKFIF